jgi:hypothetical protein
MEQVFLIFSGLVVGIALGMWISKLFSQPSTSSKPGRKTRPTDFRILRPRFEQGATLWDGVTTDYANKLPIKSSLLIPIQDLGYPEQALSLGLKLAQFTGQPLVVLVLVEVPQTHSMNANMEQEMEQAMTMLEQVEQQCTNKGVRFEANVMKVRNTTAGIIEAVATYQAGWVILEHGRTDKQTSFHGPTLAEQVNSIYTKTKCNVIMLNPAQKAQQSQLQQAKRSHVVGMKLLDNY